MVNEAGSDLGTDIVSFLKYVPWNKSGRGRQILCVIAHMCNLKTKMNKWIQQNRNRVTNTENKLVAATSGRWGGSEGQDAGGGLRGTNYHV